MLFRLAISPLFLKRRFGQSWPNRRFLRRRGFSKARRRFRPRSGWARDLAKRGPIHVKTPSSLICQVFSAPGRVQDLAKWGPIHVKTPSSSICQVFSALGRGRDLVKQGPIHVKAPSSSICQVFSAPGRARDLALRMTRLPPEFFRITNPSGQFQRRGDSGPGVLPNQSSPKPSPGLLTGR